jgi:hypothetical protein
MKKSLNYFPMNTPGDALLKINLMRAGFSEERFVRVQGYENEFVDLNKTELHGESDFDESLSRATYSLFYKGILIAQTILDKTERKMVLHEKRFWFAGNLLTERPSNPEITVQPSEINEAVLENLDFSTGYTSRPLRIQEPKITPETYRGFKPGFLEGKRF